MHWASGRASGGHLVEQVGLADAPTLPDLARSTWLMLVHHSIAGSGPLLSEQFVSFEPLSGVLDRGRPGHPRYPQLARGDDPDRSFRPTAATAPQSVNRRATLTPPRLSAKSLKRKRNCLFRACSIGVQPCPPLSSRKSFDSNELQRFDQGSKLDADLQVDCGAHGLLSPHSSVASLTWTISRYGSFASAVRVRFGQFFCVSASLCSCSSFSTMASASVSIGRA